MKFTERFNELVKLSGKTQVEIAKEINVSKNVLYNKFHSRFNCTIGEYVNKKRVEKGEKGLNSILLWV